MSTWRKYLTNEEAREIGRYKGEKKMKWKFFFLFHKFDFTLRLNVYPIPVGMIVEDT
jgi:hypothetical protein